jgi:enolase
MARIQHVQARQVLDSRGNPTVEVDVLLQDGAVGRATVPSGASTGKKEAVEMRDHDPEEYLGRGVTQAVSSVEQIIAPEITGIDALDQSSLDGKLIALDGTPEKKRLGANAVVGVSLAAAKAAAASAGLPFYRYLGGLGARELPVPMVNILSGGMHGGGNMDFQDFLAVPLRAPSFSAAIADVASIFTAMKQVLQSRGVYRAGVADEGGYAPELESNEVGFELMVEAIERAGLKAGKEAAIAVDVAASQFAHRRGYRLAVEDVSLTSLEFIERLEKWVSRYPIISVEDGLGEEDWVGWKDLTARLSARCQLIGDDLFVTRADRLQRGIREGVANAVLVKINQVGTLTETLAVLALARQHGYRAVISARSGETEDDSIADLAVATGAGQIKIGALTRSERLVKYNRLLRLEQQLGDRAQYRGAEVFQGFTA